MEDKERTLTEAEGDEPECKSEQKPEPRAEENSEQNAEPESKENSEDESELALSVLSEVPVPPHAVKLNASIAATNAASTPFFILNTSLRSSGLYDCMFSP